MKVFGWAMGQNGCSYYRLVLPLTTLAEDPGNKVEVDIGRGMPVSVMNGVADVIVSQGLLEPEPVVLWRQLALQHRTLVADYDDDLFSVRDDNPVWQRGWPNKEIWAREWQPGIQRAIGDAALVTCSTGYLANVLRQYSDNVVVLPNRIDANLLAADQPLRGPGEHLRVGWAGSPSHDRDWNQAAPYVAHGLRKVPGSELVLFGQNYSAAVGYRRTTFRPWQTDMYAYFNSLTDLHVGLAPLADDEFNRSKSYVKALEYAALGIPVIANDVGPYHDFVEHGVTGFLVKRSHEWSQYIRLLASDEGLRRQMGAAAREVARRHTVQEHAHEWSDAYETVLLSASCPGHAESGAHKESQQKLSGAVSASR